MKWADNSEIVAGLVLTHQLSPRAVRPETMIPPYDSLVRLLQDDKEQEDVIIDIGLEPVNVALEAVNNVNGAGKADWIKILEESYTMHSLGGSLQQLGKKMVRGDRPEPGMLRRIMNQMVEERTGRVKLSDITPSETPFIKSGWKVLDDHTGGLPEVGLVVVGGSPGSGKTTFAIKLSEQFARYYPKKRVLFYSLEMILPEIALRFREVGCKEDLMDRIEISADPMTEYGVIADAELSDDVGLIVVDFADYLIRGEICESSMGNVYQTLAIGAKELGVPIVLLSQFTKGYDGGIPRAHHIRYTSLAKVLAWMLLLIYNPCVDYYADADEEILPFYDNSAYIIVDKVRGGYRLHPDDSPGAIRVPWKGKLGWHPEKSQWFSMKE